jgi:hypothetical protein
MPILSRSSFQSFPNPTNSKQRTSMSLCSVCSQLDIGLENTPDQILGQYGDILERSHGLGTHYDGCGGCAFFCAVLQTSNRWNSRVSELSGHTVVLASMRLDVRAPHEMDRRRYSIDDLLFDVCTEEESQGTLTWKRLQSSR